MSRRKTKHYHQLNLRADVGMGQNWAPNVKCVVNIKHHISAGSLQLWPKRQVKELRIGARQHGDGWSPLVLGDLCVVCPCLSGSFMVISWLFRGYSTAVFSHRPALVRRVCAIHLPESGDQGTCVVHVLVIPCSAPCSFKKKTCLMYFNVKFTANGVLVWR